jgi:5-methylcytosine-specific restriction protein A
MPGNPYYQSAHWKDLRKLALERDGWRCVVPGCRHRGVKGLVVDHIKTRPPVGFVTPLDTLSNLRTLCPLHDGQLKELQGGKRRGGGLIRGCDPAGRPLDPNHRWNRSSRI